MSTPAAIVLGILIGWLIEWVVDWIYWRRRYDLLMSENKDLSGQLALCSGEKELGEAQDSNLTDSKRAVAVVSLRDDLKLIKGIGPKIEKILNGAGVTTFKQLGEQTPETLEGILGDVIRNLSDEAAIIQQARDLAKGKDERA